MVSSVTKFLEKSNRVSEPSASFLKVWLNFSKRYASSAREGQWLKGAYLRILLKVLLQHDVLTELLVVVLESRPGRKIGCLGETGHAV
jgi:hypothetical protein